MLTSAPPPRPHHTGLLTLSGLRKVGFPSSQRIRVTLFIMQRTRDQFDLQISLALSVFYFAALCFLDYCHSHWSPFWPLASVTTLPFSVLCDYCDQSSPCPTFTLPNSELTVPPYQHPPFRDDRVFCNCNFIRLNLCKIAN